VTGDSVEVCAYQTRSWYDTFVSHFGMAMQLSSRHRQNPEDPLYSVLMRLRVGAPTEDDVNLLNSAWGVGGDDAWPNHQQLRAKNCDVGTVNDRRLAELPGESVTLRASTPSTWSTLTVKPPCISSCKSSPAACFR